MKPLTILVLFTLIFVAAGSFYCGYIWKEKDSNLPPDPFMMLTINGQEWKVFSAEYIERRDDNDFYTFDLAIHGYAAYTRCDLRQIVYSEKEPDLREILLHELFHAGTCIYNDDKRWNSKSGKDGEHPGVENIAQFLRGFIPANRKFMQWEMEDQ